MKKSISLLLFQIIFVIAFCSQVFSQKVGMRDDPLSRVKDLVNSDEIILLNSQTLGSDPNVQTARSRIMDIDLNQINPDLKLVPKTVQNDSTVTGNKTQSEFRFRRSLQTH